LAYYFLGQVVDSLRYIFVAEIGLTSTTVT